MQEEIKLLRIIFSRKLMKLLNNDHYIYYSIASFLFNVFLVIVLFILALFSGLYCLCCGLLG